MSGRLRYVAAALAIAAGAAPAFADPLVTAGIGLTSCEKLAAGMKPEEGLNNQANYLIYYWVQGYMSAANIVTLESDDLYVDLSKYDEKKILPLVYEFCTKNPDKKPISVIDALLASAERITGHWEKGSIEWAAE